MQASYDHMTREELIAENQLLKAENQRLQSEVDRLTMELAQLKAEMAELKRLIFGARSERFVAQDTATAEQLKPLEEQPPEKTVKQVVSAYERSSKQQPKREKLPDNLPVHTVIIEPDAEDIAGWVKIGEEITEELDYVPGHLRIIRYIRPKYARPKAGQDQNPDQRHIIVAPLPTRVIEKGIPSAGLLAHILISKFVDHLPYYRQINMFERIGMSIPSSTINDWVARCIELLRLLYDLHQSRLMQNNYLMADETTIRVLEERKTKTAQAKKGKAHTGYFWVYHDPGGKQTLFVYDPGRAGKYPREHLKDFKGSLQTDGYKVYDAFESDGAGIRLIGCMAHVRRKFEQATGNDRHRAEHALALMQQLYAIERKAREEQYSPDKRLELRLELAKPIMDELKTWLEQEKPQVLPKSSIGEAIQYALKRWPYLGRYLEDGNLEIDNNLVENAIRPVALGRKNYLFAGSHEAAHWAAVIYSLLASASACGHNPFKYLKDVLQRLPDQPITRLDELLPPNWKPIASDMADLPGEEE